jgi:hypothetical protein
MYIALKHTEANYSVVKLAGMLLLAGTNVDTMGTSHCKAMLTTSECISDCTEIGYYSPVALLQRAAACCGPGRPLPAHCT